MRALFVIGSLLLRSMYVKQASYFGKSAKNVRLAVMSAFTAIILFSTVFLLTTGFIWFALDHLLNTLPGRISYVSSNLELVLPAVEKIIEERVPDTSEYYLIEPGGGLAHVSRKLQRAFPWKQVQVIDLGLSYLVGAKLIDLTTGTRAQYTWKNVFDHQYPKPAVIYCYLSTPILKRLYDQGAFVDSLVITLSFAIPHAKPLAEVRLPNWQERLLIYDFRGVGNRKI